MVVVMTAYTYEVLNICLAPEEAFYIDYAC